MSQTLASHVLPAPQLPIRFNLEYVTEEGSYERPVIVHRAVLGSVERMFAILTEHYAGGQGATAQHSNCCQLLCALNKQA